MRHVATISVANNYIVIKDYPVELVRSVLVPFCKNGLYEYSYRPIPGTTKKERYVSHVFARFNNDRTELRMSSSLLEDLKDFFQYRGYKTSRIKFEEIPEIQGVPVQFEWQEGWGELREKQQPWGEYQLEDGHIKINNLPPGEGKTVIATHTMVNTGTRTLITTLPKYLPVWLASFEKSLDLKPGDLLVSETSDTIDSIHKRILSGEINPKVILLPLTRFDNYFRRVRDEEEGLLPLDQMFSEMGIGLRIMDESHEAIHQVYISMLFGNFKKTIALSATLTADVQLINKIYGYIYPRKFRFKEPEAKKYIKVVAYHHRLDVWKYKIRTQGFGGYSHINFENSLRRNPKVFAYYYSLIKDCYQHFYKDEFQTGQKCLIFVATIAMVQKVHAQLVKDFPDDDFGMFTGEESKKDKFSYMKHMTLITTPKSCGTGKDIPMLRTVISPYAVCSQQLNEQMKGRLRDIEKWWPGVPPIYAYFVCDDIPKQLEYHRKRRTVFDKSAIEYIDWMSEKYLA